MTASLRGIGVTTSNNDSIWIYTGAGLSMVAREGSLAADTTGNFSTFSSLSFNNNSQVAFLATLSGATINSMNDVGIWATDTSGVLQLIAREGDSLEVAPSDFRVVSSIEFAGNDGTDDAGRSWFNDRGQLVFGAKFTDGSEGIFVSNLVATLDGDFNRDGVVDVADYVMWRKDTSIGTYSAWLQNFGDADSGTGGNSAIPEPSAIVLLFGALFGPITNLRKVR
jgi:hypothetical protein